MARTKKMVVTGVTREQAEQAFAEFAAADAKVQNLTSKMDGEMTRIREKYAEQLAALNAAKDKSFEVLQAFAVENRDELFCKKKSVESAHGVFGFRTGTPKLKNLKDFTWAAVTNLNLPPFTDNNLQNTGGGWGWNCAELMLSQHAKRQDGDQQTDNQ